MIYASIDTETTGLDTETCQLLSIGIVIEDTNNVLPIEELPKLHIAITRDNISGSMFGINMNRDLINNIVLYQTSVSTERKDQISKLTNTVYLNEDKVVECIFQFLWDNGIRPDYKSDYNWRSKPMVKVDENYYPQLASNMVKTYINVAGKNFNSLDKPMLEKLPRWKQALSIRTRIMDPAILFLDWEDDYSLPGLNECKKRAGIDGEVTHNAVDDAIDVIKLLRPQYQKPWKKYSMQ